MKNTIYRCLMVIKRNIPFFVGLVITLSLLWPLFYAPFFTHHDDEQVIRLFEMDKCFKDLQIPCRWVPDLGDEYGYPLFNYYAPLPYYYGEIIYLVIGNLIISVKIMFATAFIGAFLFMYLLGRRLWGDLGGVFSGIFYSLAPYHAVLLFVRGAMGEMWGIMFIPALFWALLRLQDSRRIVNVIFLGLFIGAILLSHNLTVMIIAPFFIIFVLMFIKSKNISGNIFSQIRFWKLFSLSVILGVFLSAFYLLPMLAERDLVHVDTTTYGYFSYTEHFKGLKKLLVDRTWGYGGSVREIPGGLRDEMSFQIGWAHLAVIIFVLFLLKKNWSKDKFSKNIIIFSVTSIIIGIFMIHPQSRFLWEIVTPLKFVQFPWRFLGIIIFFISLLAGSIFIYLREDLRIKLWVGLVILALVLNFFYFKPGKFINVTDAQLLSGESKLYLEHKAILDFLPIFASEPPAQPARSRYEIITGETDIKNFHQGSNWMTFDAYTKSHSIIRLSQYYFSDWEVKVDNKPILVEYKNNNLGLMTFILGEGDHHVDARFKDTLIRRIGNVLTVFGLLLLLVLTLTQIQKSRRWFSYYFKSLNR